VDGLPPFDFGLRIKELRKKAKLSQMQVAMRLNITKTSISKYENNVAVPSTDIIVKLALLYRVTSDYLLGLDNRLVFVIDDITPRQRLTIETINNALLTEFRLTNKE